MTCEKRGAIRDHGTEDAGCGEHSSDSPCAPFHTRRYDSVSSKLRGLPGLRRETEGLQDRKTPDRRFFTVRKHRSTRGHVLLSESVCVAA